MKEDRTRRDKERKKYYEDEAFQAEPQIGAWTGGWQDLPARRSWLELAIEARTADPVPDHPPSGVDREDDAILHDLERALRPVPGAIYVHVAEGSVALVGHVESQAAKLDAQKRARDVEGIRALFNRLEVP
jgi:hypothetical protein